MRITIPMVKKKMLFSLLEDYYQETTPDLNYFYRSNLIHVLIKNNTVETSFLRTWKIYGTVDDVRMSIKVRLNWLESIYKNTLFSWPPFKTKVEDKEHNIDVWVDEDDIFFVIPTEIVDCSSAVTNS